MSSADKKCPSEQLVLEQELTSRPGGGGGGLRQQQQQQKQASEKLKQMGWSVGSNNGDDAAGGGGAVHGQCCLDCDQDDGACRYCGHCDTGSCCGQQQDACADADADPNDPAKKNLDSGYAWLILLVMFLLQSSVSGSSRVYGIVYAKEVSINYYDREQASWPIATASAVENLAGILTPALTSYLSWRKIELLSTSLLILSNLLAYFSDSLTVDIIALGIIQGLALSVYTVLSLVINNDYFERYRTTAYGISMSGSTFGVLYLSPLVSWLLTEYDNFRLVYLALAIVFCCNIFLVLFIKPRTKTTSSSGAESAAQNNQAEGPSGPGADELEFDKIRRALEGSLGGGGGGGDTLRAAATRKRSRFELHFERKNSIASVSYLARSRRESILSRQQVCQSPSGGNMNPNYNSKPVYTTEQAPWSRLAADKRAAYALTKSKSGVELARTASENPVQEQQQRRWHKISLVQQTSSPFAGANPAQEPPASDTARATQLSELQRSDSNLTDLNSINRGSIADLASNKGAPIQTEPESGCANCVTRPGSSPLVDLENGPALPSRTPSLLMRATSKQQLQYLANCANSSSATIGFQGEKVMDVKPSPVEFKPQAGASKSSSGGFPMSRMALLLRSPYLHCTWIMLAIYYLIARVFVIILVDFADDHGFDLNQSTNLLNYWSIGELGGRILLAPLIDLQYMSCKNCIFTTCSLLAGFIVTMVMVESYIAYAVCSTAIAALISLEYMLINVLMVEYVGKEQVSSCYSLAACLCSIVLFARPSMIGLFRDQLGSYDGLLILLASVAGVFALVFYAIEPVLVRYWPKRQLEQAL